MSPCTPSRLACHARQALLQSREVSCGEAILGKPSQVPGHPVSFCEVSPMPALLRPPYLCAFSPSRHPWRPSLHTRSSYRRHTGQSRAIGSVAAQSQAALNATRHARFSVIVLTAGAAVVICPQMVNSGDDASQATTPYPAGGGGSFFLRGSPSPAQNNSKALAGSGDGGAYCWCGSGGAAAYGVVSRASEEARTHGCLLS